MKPDDWRRYFFLDLESITFEHTENCGIVNNKKECKTIKHIELRKSNKNIRQ